MDRRKGPTCLWVLFWQFLIGERRTGKERRSIAEKIVYGGCTGNCNQGRNCTCE